MGKADINQTMMNIINEGIEFNDIVRKGYSALVDIRKISNSKHAPPKLRNWAHSVISGFWSEFAFPTEWMASTQPLHKSQNMVHLVDMNLSREVIKNLKESLAQAPDELKKETKKFQYNIDNRRSRVFIGVSIQDALIKYKNARKLSEIIEFSTEINKPLTKSAIYRWENGEQRHMFMRNAEVLAEYFGKKLELSFDEDRDITTVNFNSVVEEPSPARPTEDNSDKFLKYFLKEKEKADDLQRRLDLQYRRAYSLEKEKDKLSAELNETTKELIASTKQLKKQLPSIDPYLDAIKKDMGKEAFKKIVKESKANWLSAFGDKDLYKEKIKEISKHLKDANLTITQIQEIGRQEREPINEELERLKSEANEQYQSLTDKN